MNKVPEQNFEFNLDELSSSEQVELYKYWQKIRKDKILPSRADFNPMDIPRVLPYIIMEDVSYDPLKFKVRLIGSKCKTQHRYMGNYLNDFPEMNPMVEVLKVGVEMRKPFFYFNYIRTDEGLIRPYSSLVVPFSNNNNNINIMMGCLCYIDQ